LPTIVPEVREDVWLSALKGLEEWRVPHVPTVVLAPHPDDESLGAGGLIAHLRANGVPVTVVAVTDGEAAYANDDGQAELRVVEQAAALRQLDVSETAITRLHLPDSDVSAHEETLFDMLLPLVAEGTQLVAPWPRDFHPDHEAVGRVAARVAEARGVDVMWYLFWTWHRGTPEILRGRSIVKLSLDQWELARKRDAIGCHVSQLHRGDGQPILSEELLAPTRWPFEVYLR
jgi:LmbE family N-acetylglucosaminyl deacetylase